MTSAGSRKLRAPRDRAAPAGGPGRMRPPRPLRPLCSFRVRAGAQPAPPARRGSGSQASRGVRALSPWFCHPELLPGCRSLTLPFGIVRLERRGIRGQSSLGSLERTNTSPGFFSSPSHLASALETRRKQRIHFAASRFAEKKKSNKNKSSKEKRPSLTHLIPLSCPLFTSLALKYERSAGGTRQARCA